MDGLTVLFKVLEVAPRFFIRSKPPEIDYTPLFQKLPKPQELPASETLRPTPSKPSPGRSVTLPTTEETVAELRRRLGMELYKMELDLQEGARIAGHACDCLSRKHNLGLEATAKELMSYERNPVYGEILGWLEAHEAEFEPSEIAKRPPQHYQALAPEMRKFRKAVMEPAAETSEPVRQRARELAERVRAGKLSRGDAVTMLADDLAKGRQQLKVPSPQPEQPRLVGPRERRELPEELQFFADSRDHIEDSMNRNGLRPKLEEAFKEAIARARGGK